MYRRRRSTREPLHVVPVVVGDEDVGDAVQLELVEPVEDETAAEVDADAVPAGTKDPDVAGVADAGELRRGHPRESNPGVDVATIALRFGNALDSAFGWARSSSTGSARSSRAASARSTTST